MAMSRSLRTPPGKLAIVCWRYAPRPKRSSRCLELGHPSAPERAGRHDRHARLSRDAERHQHVVLSGQAGEKLRDLEGAADARARRTRRGASPVMSRAVEHDAPGIGLEIAGDDVDEGGLAGAVVADQAEPLAAPRPSTEMSLAATTAPKRFLQAARSPGARSFGALGAALWRRLRRRSAAAPRQRADARRAGTG